MKNNLSKKQIDKLKRSIDYKDKSKAYQKRLGITKK